MAMNNFFSDDGDEVREDDIASVALSIRRTPSMVTFARAHMFESIGGLEEEVEAHGLHIMVWSHGTSSVAEGLVTVAQNPLLIFQNVYGQVLNYDEFRGVIHIAWGNRHGLDVVDIQWYHVFAEARGDADIWPGSELIEYVYDNTLSNQPPHHFWSSLQGVIIWESRTSDQLFGAAGLFHFLADYFGLDLEEQEDLIDVPPPINPNEAELLLAPPLQLPIAEHDHVAAPPQLIAEPEAPAPPQLIAEHEAPAPPQLIVGHDHVAAPPQLIARHDHVAAPPSPAPIAGFDVALPPSPLHTVVLHDEAPPLLSDGDVAAAPFSQPIDENEDEEYLNYLVDTSDGNEDEAGTSSKRSRHR